MGQPQLPSDQWDCRGSGMWLWSSHPFCYTSGRLCNCSEMITVIYWLLFCSIYIIYLIHNYMDVCFCRPRTTCSWIVDPYLCSYSFCGYHFAHYITLMVVRMRALDDHAHHFNAIFRLPQALSGIQHRKKKWQFIYQSYRQWLVRIACMCNTRHSANEVV